MIHGQCDPIECLGLRFNEECRPLPNAVQKFYQALLHLCPLEPAHPTQGFTAEREKLTDGVVEAGHHQQP